MCVCPKCFLQLPFIPNPTGEVEQHKIQDKYVTRIGRREQKNHVCLQVPHYCQFSILYFGHDLRLHRAPMGARAQGHFNLNLTSQAFISKQTKLKLNLKDKLMRKEKKGTILQGGPSNLKGC